MRAYDIIDAKRRNIQELSSEEIDWFISGIMSGEVTKVQAAAWLMAVCIQGMKPRETADLTRAMVASGKRLNLSSLGQFVADKHSTGGVGDKTTLVVAPLVAAAGVPVGKMSGRGLGYSGGTIDKLESIPGFRTRLKEKKFLETLQRVGIVVAAQTSDLAPADGLLYKLRDVTATVESLPLIASSIMSKKIAAGATGVVLDVKVGNGAFMKNLQDARELAKMMRAIGSDVGLQVRAVLSGMDQPLGWAVGNALEIKEAVETLRGHGPQDLLEVALTLGSHLLHMAGKSSSVDEGRDILMEVLASGKGLQKFREFIEAQGGDSTFIDAPNDPPRLPQAPIQHQIVAPRDGYIAAIDTEAIGKASVLIGAGRKVEEDKIDHSVGFVLRHKLGDKVERGETLLVVHAASETAVKLVEPKLLAAFVIKKKAVVPPPTVLDIIDDR